MAILSDDDRFQGEVHRDAVLAGFSSAKPVDDLLEAESKRLKADGFEDAPQRARDALKDPATRAAAIERMRAAAPKAFIRKSWRDGDFVSAYKTIIRLQSNTARGEQRRDVAMKRTGGWR